MNKEMRGKVLMLWDESRSSAERGAGRTSVRRERWRDC